MWTPLAATLRPTSAIELKSDGRGAPRKNSEFGKCGAGVGDQGVLSRTLGCSQLQLALPLLHATPNPEIH